MVGGVGGPVPDDAERERALARQWRLAQVNLLLALLLLAVAGLWWFSADATWQAPTFTVLGILITVAAISNVRQQQRNRRLGRNARTPGSPWTAWGSVVVGDTGIEPVTSSVSGKRATAAPIARSGLATGPSSAPVPREGDEVETGFEPV